MIIAPLLSIVMLHAADPTPTKGDDACKGVVDRTAQCAAPAETSATIPPDIKAAPPKIPGPDPAVLPGELAFIASGMLVGGGALVGYTYVTTDPRQTAEETQFKDAVRNGGYSLMIASGLAASAALTYAVFDPSTGKMRIASLEKEGAE